MVTNTLRVATANASRADEPQSNRQLASITHFISMGSGLPHPDTTNIAACQEQRIPRLLPASTTSPPTPPSPPAPTGAPGDPDDDGGNTPELVRLYYRYLSQPTKDRLDDLLKQCLKFLDKRISDWVYARRFCPPCQIPDLFSQDAFDRASNKFWSKLHKLRNPDLLERWLKKIAFRSVVEELRKVEGREKGGPRHYMPFVIKNPDGTETHVLDRAENVDAAARYGAVTIQQTQFVKQLVFRDILGKVFHSAKNCSERERLGIELLKYIHDYNLTVDEIAAERGLKKSCVQSLLRAGKQKLRQIAETKYGLTAENL